MKVLPLTLVFFCLLSSPVFMGCTDNQKNSQESAATSGTSADATDSLNNEAPTAKISWRLAVIEYRYPTPDLCIAAAKKYFTGTEELSPLPGSPLTYSFCDSNAPTQPSAMEIRFTVNATSPVQPPDTINYYEVEQRTGNNRNDIRRAFRRLRNECKFDSIKGPTEDRNNVNGVKSWRAIMRKKDTPCPEVMQFLDKREEDFGLIINPPFPR
jgi:hypothetical protein